MELQDIAQIGGMITTLIGAVWFLSTRIQRVAGLMETLTAKFEARLEAQSAIMSQHQSLHEGARQSRAEIWQEINGTKERVVRLETQVDSITTQQQNQSQ
jgi:hypothetical protein